jgi:hypothetical protein
LTVKTGDGALFPALAAGDYFYATLIDNYNQLEIIKVTARTGDVLTITRAQDGTTARVYTIGDKVEIRLTVAALNDLVAAAATTSTAGIVQLTDSVASTSITTAATPNSVKTAYDLANTANTTANSALTVANAALPKAGGTVTGAVTFSNTIVGSINGNAATVTNGVYTTGDQSIAGIKTFAGAAFTDANFRAYVAGGVSLVLFDNASAQADYFYYERAANRFAWAVNSIDKLSLDSTGNLTASGNVTAYSDERLKKDWGPVAVDFVSKLADVKSGTYTRIDNSDVRQAGVSAQSLQSVLPETVIEDIDGNLSVAYGNAALVSAVELAKELVALRKRVEELEAS